MNAYSKDLRLKTLSAIDRGIPRKGAAGLFGVSLSTIKRWLKRRQETGDVRIYEIPGGPSVKGAALREWLPMQLEANPDLTLKEHREAFFEETGVGVSEATMSRQIARLAGEWPLKKVEGSLRARRGSQQGSMEMVPRSPRREKARVRGRERVSRSDGSLEGEGAHKGERAYGKVPRNRGKNTTLLASMSLHGMGATMVVEGATDAEAFEVYAEHFLAPSLREGQVVVFDNLGAHEPRRVRELIEARGAEVLFLPSYCPDSNPIEEAFSKIKGIVGKAGARTREALLEAIAQALSAITPVDAAGWFSH